MITDGAIVQMEGGKLVLIEGGHEIHRWNRLVIYIKGTLWIQRVQEHRGHGGPFSVSTNQKPVFGHMTGLMA